MVTFSVFKTNSGSPISLSLNIIKRGIIMSQLVKAIISKLNTSPFNLNFTSVSLNALTPGQLLQVSDKLSNRCREIDLYNLPSC